MDKYALFTYLYLCWVFIALYGFSLVAESRGYSLVVVLRLLIAVASHNGVLALGHAGFSSWGIEAQ